MRLILVAAALAVALPATAQRLADWPIADREAARAAATLVAIVYVESARQPRGERGNCPVNGRIVRVERGTAAFGAPVGAMPPCRMFADGSRDVPMSAMHDGQFARLYFDADRRLLDYEPLVLVPSG